MKKTGIIIGVIVIVLAIIFVGIFVGNSNEKEKKNISDLSFQYGEEIAVTGEVVCLPHRDQTGPQTLECAVGLEKDGNTYFALQSIGDGFISGDVRTGDHVRVSGVFKKRDPEGRYAVVGAIAVKGMKKLDLPPADWSGYLGNNPDFSINFPDNWSFSKSGPIATNGIWWTNLSATRGQNFITIATPEGYLSGTNFRNARVTVGRSNSEKVVAQCLNPKGESPRVTSSRVTINGMNFTKIHFVGAAAGSRYDTTAYRVLRNGYCYSVESLLSYGAIEMYGEDSEVEKFDKEQVEDTLGQIIASFSFTK